MNIWYAERDDEALAGRRMWRPVLQLDGHVCAFAIWFDTEQECVAFIRNEVMPATLDPEMDGRIST